MFRPHRHDGSLGPFRRTAEVLWLFSSGSFDHGGWLDGDSSTAAILPSQTLLASSASPSLPAGSGVRCPATLFLSANGADDVKCGNRRTRQFCYGLLDRHKTLSPPLFIVCSVSGSNCLDVHTHRVAATQWCGLTRLAAFQLRSQCRQLTDSIICCGTDG